MLRVRIRVGRLFAQETTTSFWILGTALFLVLFGVVMVLSSGSVESIAVDRSPFNTPVKQLGFAALGLVAMLFVSRLRGAALLRFAGVALIVALFLQFLVLATPLGWGYGGNRNWLTVFPGGGNGVSIQPSEFLKLTVGVWLGASLANAGDRVGDLRTLFTRVLPLPALGLAMVAVGSHDLGTAIVLSLMIFIALVVAGVPLRILAGMAVVAVVAVAVLSTGSESRQRRIGAWLAGCPPERMQDECWQTVHGLWALADGGLFGVGLGGSKAKWAWLPEADNDFIFAVIGEELGLVGAVVLLGVFGLLAVLLLRAMTAGSGPGRIVIGAIMAWVIGQALINVGVVLGFLPVLGVPLPLVSAGGSSLVAVLTALGVVRAFATEDAVPRATVASAVRAGGPRAAPNAAPRPTSTAVRPRPVRFPARGVPVPR